MCQYPFFISSILYIYALLPSIKSVQDYQHIPRISKIAYGFPRCLIHCSPVITTTQPGVGISCKTDGLKPKYEKIYKNFQLPLAFRLQVYYNNIQTGGGRMSEPILRISPKKYNGETTIVSMRVSKDMLKDLDMVASSTGRNRNEIMSMSLEFALNHMEIVIRGKENTIK
jgi:hypothetical protein